MAKPKHAWMVRAGNDNELADLVEEKNAVAIGWPDMGDLSGLQSLEEFKERYRESTIYIPVDAQLEENGHPRMYFRAGKSVDLTNLFGGRLERKHKHWFQAGFNITRG